jgi:hypothetical protein
MPYSFFYLLMRQPLNLAKPSAFHRKLKASDLGTSFSNICAASIGCCTTRDDQKRDPD